jgi:hypothetical protein
MVSAEGGLHRASRIALENMVTFLRSPVLIPARILFFRV